MKYSADYRGHQKAQRKAVVQMGLANEKELPHLTDSDIEKAINESDYMIFYDGEDYTLLHMDYAKHLIHINR